MGLWRISGAKLTPHRIPEEPGAAELNSPEEEYRLMSSRGQQSRVPGELRCGVTEEKGSAGMNSRDDGELRSRGARAPGGGGDGLPRDWGTGLWRRWG